MTEPLSTIRRTTVAAQILLIAPAALFMAAVFARNLVPPAGPQQIVMWYAGRSWTLWGLLITLPLAVLALGVMTLRASWQADEALRQSVRQTLAAARAHLATLLVGVVSLAAFGVLAMVALHMLAN